MRKKFILHLRTPKGDRRLEQVATSPREALQQAFGALGAQLPSGLPDDARCRLECEGQVLGFCPDELGVLSGALHADEDVLDSVDRRPKKDRGTPSYRYLGEELMKQLMDEFYRERIIKVLHPEQRTHRPSFGWPSPRTYAVGGIVKIDDKTYTITDVDGDLSLTGSIVPPPAPSAPASGSTTGAPERTPEL